MTVVIGYVNRKTKETIMGADRCISNSLERNTFASSKIYQPAENPNFLIGISGDPRVHQLIKGFLVFPRESELQVDETIVDDRFIIRAIIPQINKIMLEQHYFDPDFSNTGSSIMIAYKDNIWRIGPGYQLISYEEDFLTMGSGQFAARGVLATLEDTKMLPMNKVIKALTLSTKMAVGVDGPYDIYVTGKGKLNDEQLRMMIEDTSKPEVIQTQKFNYIKKVVKEDVSLVEELYNSEDDEILYFTKDGEEVFFVDYNSILGVLKPNGDIVYNSDDIEEVGDEVWDVVEINAKAQSLLNSVSDKFKLELSEEEIEELENQQSDIDIILEQLLAEKEEIDKAKAAKKAKKKEKEVKTEKETKKKKSSKKAKKEVEEVTPKEIEKPKQKTKKKKSSKKDKKEEVVEEIKVEEE